VDVAYVASYLDSSLVAIDVSDPTNPAFKGFIYGVGSPNYLDRAMAIDVLGAGRLVYVAAYGDSALNILYVRDLQFPGRKGGIRNADLLPASSWLVGANGIKVVGNYGYVTGFGGDSLAIIDITNPTSPSFVGGLQGAGAPNLLDGAWGIDVVGNYAYVAAYGDSALVIIDISNPTSPTLRGSIQYSEFTGEPKLYGARNVRVVGSIAYVVSYYSNSLVVIDVSDPRVPTVLGDISGGANYLNRASGLDVVGNYAYVAAYTDDALTIIDISDPTNPTLAGSIQGAGSPNYLNGARAVRVRGNYAYVAAYLDNALSIFDITDPTNPTLAGSIQGAAYFLRGASDVFPTNWIAPPTQLGDVDISQVIYHNIDRLRR
jgi:hypothetical protein